MWKARNDDRPSGSSQNSNSAPGTAVSGMMPPAGAPRAAPPLASGMMTRAGENFHTEVAHIGKSVLIKGELSGSEDLYLDGEVEGSIELKQHSMTVGPHGRVKANVHAREVVVHGKIDGNVQGDEKVELKKSAILMGDISTQRIVIEDGAYFKGAIDIQKEGKTDTREYALGAAAGIHS